ncbi:MAG: RNA-binding cell elongation regulator Jag/EloR [Candidatus Onthomonas sp.]
MTKFIETTGKTEELAIAAALKQLGMDRDDVSVEIITRAKTGFLGIGSCPAKVRVSYEVEEPAAPVIAPVKEAPVQAEAAPEAPKAEVKAEVKPEPKPQKAEPKAPKAPKAAKPQPKSQAKAPKIPKEPKPAPAAEPPAPKAEQPAAPAVDRSEDILSFLNGLMEHLEVEATPVITAEDDGVYQVELTGEGLGALIGRRGETLDAIQQLTNYAVNHGQNRRVRVHVDCENYRAKREESLQRLARKTAGKAVKYRKNMMLEPMNAYERHVIHAELQDYHPNISTYSTGTEPNRRIVVAYNK